MTRKKHEADKIRDGDAEGAVAEHPFVVLQPDIEMDFAAIPDVERVVEGAEGGQPFEDSSSRATGISSAR